MPAPATTPCKLCGEPLTAEHVRATDVYTDLCCPTCGTYRILLWAKDFNYPAEVRHLLSAATRRASDQKKRLALDTDPQEVLDSIAEPDPLEKIDLLLRVLAARSPTFGEGVKLTKHDYPLVLARNANELNALLSAAGKKGLTSFATGEDVALTLPGWQRVAELKKASPASTQAFVAMWFDESLDRAWNEGFKTALEEMGYAAIRVDGVEHNGKIDDLIIKSIRESGLLVADFTGHRAGVYYETGFAYGLGLHIIRTCRKDEIDKTHFDTRQYNHITWTDPADLRTRLCARIAATIPDYPGRPRE